MQQRKNFSLALTIITLGFLLLGFGLGVYFKQQMIPMAVAASGSAKPLNSKLEGDVLGKIKEWVKDSTFTPPVKLPF